jgi:uncharacterized membrane protein
MEGLTTITAWLPYIFSGIAAIISIYSMTSQLRKDKADVAGQYQIIADKAAERAVRYETRIEDLERKVDSLMTSVVELEDWAKRLCNQVHNMGGTPVPRHQRRISNHNATPDVPSTPNTPNTNTP